MNFTVIDFPQRSDEWRAARVGRLTGSRAAAMMAKIKSGEAAARRNLRIGLALERVTQRPYERAFTTRVTQQGIDCEPMALGMYEARMGCIVERTGFLSSGPVMVGCSLDGHINDFEGIIEAKCPESATHLEYLRTRKIPDDYRWQCIHNMWVSGARWCDFISFDPSFPTDLQFLCVRLERKEEEISAYQRDAERFLAEVSVEVGEIQKLRAA
jgi:predicted phage-related endonuclease